MTYQPFLIAPFSTGLDTDLEPWLIPQDAFDSIENAHVHHGVIEKRSGYFKLADLVHNNGSNWDISGITQADPGVVTVTATTGLSNGDEIEMRNVLGMTEVNGQRYFVANLTGTTFELTDENGVDVDTSGFTAYSSGGEVYLIPRHRVMGIQNYIDSGNIKQLLAFDTKRACIYNTGTMRFDPLDTADIFSGSDTDFIWGANWASTASTAASVLYRLYFTNGKPNAGGSTDGIRYYDPATSSTATTQYNPNINGATEIRGGKLIFAYRQRLVLLHTFEGGNTYPQRARWCQAQNPNASDAWDDNVAGKGGFVDAPTGDQIISARFVQDTLVVLFTNSVWTLRPVPDPALPFRWDKINDFRACDGKIASEGFDRYVIGVGIRGITATDGVETRRIDERIENFIKDEVNNSEFGKTFLARSFGNRRLWMLYAGQESDDPENALIYDEEGGAFSTYDISMNVLGYGGVAQDLALNDFTDEAADEGLLPLTLIDAADLEINSFVWDQSDEIFLGGDRNGTIHILEADGSDQGASIELNLQSAAWNPFKEQGIEAQMGYIDLFIDTHPNTLLNLQFFKNNEFTPYATSTIDCLPKINEITTITQITKKSPASSGITILAPEHGLTTDDEIYIYLVEGMEEINGGPYSVTVLTEDSFEIAIDSTDFVDYTSGGVLTELPFRAEKVWKRVYAGGVGYQHKIEVSSGGIDRPLRIHGLMPWFRPRGRRVI